MKIRILNKNEYCVAKNTDQGLIIGGSCLDDCCLPDDYKLFLEHLGENCITQAVEPEELFFFRISRFKNRREPLESKYYGFLKKSDHCFVLNITEYIDGPLVSLDLDETYLISGFHPYDVTPRATEFDNFVLTSDHLLSIGKNQFLGFKNGEIDALDPDEVVQCLSSSKFHDIKLQKRKARPKRPQQGTLIFNELSGTLEFYVNKQWRTLKLED